MFVAWCERECVLFVLSVCMHVCVEDREKRTERGGRDMVLFVLLCFHQPRVPGFGAMDSTINCFASLLQHL